MGLKDWITEKLGRKVYSYELQECGRAPKGGWATIAIMDKFEKTVALAEYFRPGMMYRLMARDMEKGTYAKVKWKHFEPSLEIQKVREKEERPSARVATPSDIMTMWAEGLEKQMVPVFTFGKVMKSLRESFDEAFGSTGGGGGGAPSIPALEFEGKAPWMMHPYIVQNIGDTVKGVTDHFFGKLDEFRTKALTPPQEAEAPAVEFPVIEEYMPEAPTPTPEMEAPSVEEEKEVTAEEKPEEAKAQKKRRKESDEQGSG